VKDMLKKFDMADAKPIKTPMVWNGHLNLNEEGKSVDQKYIAPWSALFFTFIHLDPILCLVCASVQDFKPILSNVI
jgi:hypothetical protein